MSEDRARLQKENEQYCKSLEELDIQHQEAIGELACEAVGFN